MFYKGSAISGSGGGSGDAVWGSITGTLSDQTDLAAALADKQDKLTAGTGIDITNNVISVTGGGSSSYDDETINENASNELQAIGVKEARTDTAIRLWHGMQEQYNIGGGVKDTYYGWDRGVSSTSTINSVSNSMYAQGSLAYGNGVIIAVNQSGNTDSQGAWKSTDNGNTWTKITFVDEYVVPYCVFFVNGEFILHDIRYIIRSTDGINWTHTSKPSDTPYQFRFLAYGNGVYIGTTSYDKNIYRSMDGINYQVVKTTSDYVSVSYGNGLFLYIKSGGNTTEVGYSTDGSVWNTTSIDNGSYCQICYDGSKFLTCNYSGYIVTSTDGITWTTVKQESLLANCEQLWYLGSKFVFVKSYNTSIVYSYDGINWKTSNATITNGAYRKTLVYDDIADSYVSLSGQNTTADIFSFDSYYTLDEVPTTSSQVYTAPDVTSALTITSVDTANNTITLSDTYTYNEGGNAYSYYTVAETHPNYLCAIDSVGMKMGNNDIANLSNYTEFTGATSSVAGSAGLVPAPTTSDVDKYLKGDGTWAAVSGGGGSVSYDNTTINENSSNQLQTIGIIDQNSGNALQIWKGTETEWNYGSGQEITWYDYLNIDEQYQGIDQFFAFNKAAYGNGIYVTVGQNGTIYSSYDGKHWYPETSGTQADLYGVVFGQGQFIAVGADIQQGGLGVILSSNDGKSWTSQTPNTNDGLNSVACNEGLLGFEFVAVGQHGAVVTSTDGRDWVSQTSGSSENLNKVAVTESGYVIVGDNDTLIFFDGNFSTNYAGSSCNWYGVAVQTEGNPRTIMIAGNDGMNGLILSSDDGGTNWNSENVGMPEAWNDITYGNGRFVAVGQMGEIVYGANHNWFPYIAQMGFAPNIIFINGKYYAFNSAVHILTFNDCYTTNDTIPADPTTLVIYDKPNEQSSMTCVSENSGNIVLSDGNEYTLAGNIPVNASVGYEHPDYICFIDDVGVKIGCKKF